MVAVDKRSPEAEAEALFARIDKLKRDAEVSLPHGRNPNVIAKTVRPFLHVLTRDHHSSHALIRFSPFGIMALASVSRFEVLVVKPKASWTWTKSFALSIDTRWKKIGMSMFGSGLAPIWA